MLDYLGCYQDNSTRILSFDPYSSTAMTIEMCLTYCVTQGYKYAGLEYM